MVRSPDAFDSIVIKRRISTQDYRLQFQRLRYQNTIDWISVMKRKRPHPIDVFRFNRKEIGSQLRHRQTCYFADAQL